MEDKSEIEADRRALVLKMFEKLTGLCYEGQSLEQVGLTKNCLELEHQTDL